MATTVAKVWTTHSLLRTEVTVRDIKAAHRTSSFWQKALRRGGYDRVTVVPLNPLLRVDSIYFSIEAYRGGKFVRNILIRHENK